MDASLIARHAMATRMDREPGAEVGAVARQQQATVTIELLPDRPGSFTTRMVDKLQGRVIH
jgi:hypothetical protein